MSMCAIYGAKSTTRLWSNSFIPCAAWAIACAQTRRTGIWHANESSLARLSARRLVRAAAQCDFCSGGNGHAVWLAAIPALEPRGLVATTLDAGATDSRAGACRRFE